MVGPITSHGWIVPILPHLPMAEIFISYAHLDDDASDNEAKWIDSFRKLLGKNMQKYLGRRPEIWRDKEQLERNDNLKDEIFRTLPEILILLPLLSPAYLNSRWCPDELDRFVSDALPKPPWKVADRVFKILLVPESLIGKDLMPEILDNKLGYQFFTIPEQPKDEWDFKEIGPGHDEFLDLLTDLAKDLCRVLKKRNEPPKGTIYISKPTRDINARYLSIVRDWKEKGYEILPPPRDRLPDNRKAFTEEVSQMLERSDLSIHLFGRRSRDPDDTADFSRHHLEFELAKARCVAGKLESIVWAPKDLAFPAEDDDQEDFVKQESEAKDMPSCIEFVRSDFRIFVDAVGQRVEGMQKRRASTPAPAVPKVYLVYDKCDRGSPGRQSIAARLREAGLQVLTPRPDDEGEDPSQLEKDHRSRLTDAAGVLFFSGESKSSWLEDRQSEALSHCTREGQPVVFYFAAPLSDYKKFEFVCPARASRISDEGSFDPASLQGFIDAVKSGARP